MKINEFIVVEGKDDTERVKSAVDCDTTVSYTHLTLPTSDLV